MFIVFATVNPERWLQRHHRVSSSSAASRGSRSARRKTSSGIRASSTCELLLEDCRVAGRKRARRGRPRLQGRHRDAQRRPHRHRRADDRARAGRARPRRSRTRRSASSSARRSPIFRACSSSSRAPRRSSKPRGCSSTTPPGCATAANRFSPPAAMCKLFAADAAEHVSSLAVQLFGGYGYVKDYPVEKLYRDAKIGQIYEGTIQPAAADDCEANTGWVRFVGSTVRGWIGLAASRIRSFRLRTLRRTRRSLGVGGPGPDALRGPTVTARRPPNAPRT